MSLQAGQQQGVVLGTLVLTSLRDDMRNSTVFLVWQSDLGPTRNKVKKALEAATGLLATDAHAVALDYDMRGEAGSPPIDHVIFRKIRDAHVVVCDITPVGSTAENSDGSVKALPNPNVMVELGYAIATVGHNRVITVRDMTVEGDLPFDIRQLRYSGFETWQELRDVLLDAIPLCLDVSVPPGDSKSRTSALRLLASVSANAPLTLVQLAIELDHLAVDSDDVWAQLSNRLRDRQVINPAVLVELTEHLYQAIRPSSSTAGRDEALRKLENFLRNDGRAESAMALSKSIKVDGNLGIPRIGVRGGGYNVPATITSYADDIIGQSLTLGVDACALRDAIAESRANPVTEKVRTAFFDLANFLEALSPFESSFEV